MVDVEIVMDLAAMAALPASGLLSCFFFAMAAAMVPASVATTAVAVATIAASGLLFYSSSSVATTAVAADANSLASVINGLYTYGCAALKL